MGPLLDWFDVVLGAELMIGGGLICWAIWRYGSEFGRRKNDRN